MRTLGLLCAILICTGKLIAVLYSLVFSDETPPERVGSILVAIVSVLGLLFLNGRL